MKLVTVEWLDAAHIHPGAWTDRDNIKAGMTVTSVGFLVKRTRKRVVLAQSREHHRGELTGVFVIPTGTVVKVRTLH